MVIIGGPGSFWGVLASSAVLAVLPDLLRFTTDLRMVLYGVVLIVGDAALSRRRGRLAPSPPSRALATAEPGGPMTGAPLLEVRGLTKRYLGLTAVDDVSYEVEAGAIVGLIGPNGSGKSTSIDCISGFQPADGGQLVSRRRRADRPAAAPDRARRPDTQLSDRARLRRADPAREPLRRRAGERRRRLAAGAGARRAPARARKRRRRRAAATCSPPSGLPTTPRRRRPSCPTGSASCSPSPPA